MAHGYIYKLSDFHNYKGKQISLSQEFEELIGQPELKGAWMIWGNSANGKTRFALQLAKELARYEKVLYNSLEEGYCLSMVQAMSSIGFKEVENNIRIADQMPMNELIKEISKQRSANIIIIDSLQYCGMKYEDWKFIRDKFKNKLFIFISHADGREPRGEMGKTMKYDSFVKIRVEGFKAMAISRYGGGKPYIIWDQGARDYWININDK
ncbi:hypothetical protein N9251_00600 [Gammaproteobacteria bacterium]|nr:hypothetical protein [Gammaproteobacteria bacterium]